MASEKSKSLNAPDAFQVQAYSVMDRLARNPKPLLIGSGIVLALLVGGYALKFFNDNKVEKRQSAVAEVDRIYESEMKKFSDEREALEKQRDTLIAKQPAPVEGQTAAETPEVKAINEQIKGLKAVHDDSANKYLEFYKSEPKSAEGLAAGLRYASYLAEKNDLDGAKKQLEPLIQESKSHNVIYMQSLMMMVSIELDKSEFDAALKHADLLVGAAGPELMAKALLTKGQVLFLKKDFPAAKTVLDKVVTDHSTSPDAERARGLLALIPA